ncbi:30621_t:CDS:1, partial [Gigaspora margarita]
STKWQNLRGFCVNSYGWKGLGANFASSGDGSWSAHSVRLLIV